MVFVPVPPPRFPPSPRAQDLSRRLTQVIEEFERQYPGTSPEDVQQAMALAVGRGAGRPATRRTAVVAAAVFAAVAAVGLIRSSGGAGIPVMAIVTGLAVTVAIVVMVARMRRE